MLFPNHADRTRWFCGSRTRYLKTGIAGGNEIVMVWVKRGARRWSRFCGVVDSKSTSSDEWGYLMT